MFPKSETDAVREEEAVVADDNIILVAGTWVRQPNGVMDFKLDMSRMGRSVNCRKIEGIDELRAKVSDAYDVDRKVVSVELSYYVFGEKHGKASEPTEMVSNRDYRSFLSLHKADKSRNLFVTLREMVGEELAIMRPKPSVRDGLSIQELSNGLEDDVEQSTSDRIFGEGEDDEFLRAVDAMEAKALVAKGSEVKRMGIGADESGWNKEYEDGMGSDDVPDVEEGDYDYEDGEYDWDWWTEYVRNDGEGEAAVKNRGLVGSDGDDDFVDQPEVRNLGKGITRIAAAAAPNLRFRETRSCNDDEDFCEHPPLSRKREEKYRGNGDGEFVLETPQKPKEYPHSVFSKREDDYYGDDFIDPPSAPASGVELGPANLRKGIRLTEIYGFEDVEPMFDDMCDKSSLTIHDLDLAYEDTNIFVGRLFKHKVHFKTTLAIYALKNVFCFRYHKHAHNYTVARCISKKCDWRIMAKQVGDSQTYEVRKAHLEHVCDVDARGSYTKHATAKVIAALLRSKYESCVGPRARDLPASVLKEHRVFASYWKCWKARELAIADAQGTEEDSYKLLPKYMYLLKYANPGSLCHLHTEVDDKGARRFKFAFVALKTCIDGWKHLRKVVVVDGTHMFGKYRGAILTASGQDANFQIFPIAFAVVDSENDESWLWFFEKLRDIISDGSELAMISDRAPSIATAKAVHYPLAHHGYCLIHIQRNVNQKFTKRRQKYIVGVAGEAYTKAKFKRVYELLKETDVKCWKYMERVDVRLWARAYFEGDRYNLMSSNIAESLNKALLPARGSPVVAVIEFIRHMLSRWFVSRQKKIEKMNGEDIPPAVDKEMLKQLHLSTALTVRELSQWDYEVSLNNMSHHVSLEKRICSCGEFQMLKIPCRHAIAAATRRGMPYKSLVDDAHKMGRWSDTLQGTILPIPDPDDIDMSSYVEGAEVCPPVVKRPPGRPPKRRIASIGEYEVPPVKKKKPNKCGRCGNSGHNRATCKEPMA